MNETSKDSSKAPMILERRGQIAEMVRRNGSVRVGELAERFRVSEVTIRLDLVALEKEGELMRDRGGAIAQRLLVPVQSLMGMELRSQLNNDSKKRIGQAAAQFVQPGDTIILDAGTTVVEMVPFLAGIEHLTVVTNALNVALALNEKTTAKVLLLGGNLSRESCSTLGPIGERTLADMVVQKTFLGAQALDIRHGITDSTPEIAQSKRAMIHAARKVVLLVDSSKWGRGAFIKVAPVGAVHTLISDGGLPGEARTSLEQSGVELILA
ncbi:MAG: DeoR/GlpR family DNA-binding transcription regulator [Chthoniobacteraceae bacterium]